MSKQIETVTLKFPFDIKNLKPKMLKMNGIYSSSKEEATYNIELFGAVKYEVTQLIKRLKVGREHYEHVVYAWRSTSKLPPGSTLVGQLKFITQTNETTKTIHVNIELLPLLENQLMLCPRVTPIEDDLFEEHIGK